MSTFLFLTGISGSVTDERHQQWIRISTFQFSIHRHINTLPGQIFDRQVSQPSISELAFTKPIDSSSALLFQKSCTAKSITEAKIDLCQAKIGGHPTLRIHLSTIIVTQYQLDYENQSQQKAIERIKLSFDRIEFRYTSYDKDNQPSSPINAGYDLKNATLL